MSDEKFLLEYERLLDKGYCDCNEMNCIDNDSPRRILRIAKNLQRENQELKKQLDELQTLYNNMFKCHCNRVQVETLLEQQKEFIEYLESKIDTIIQQKETFAELEAGQAVSLMTLAIALEKYKEIIGGKDE